jgi:lipoprotein-anchoring transpeptidase ErfK/SrfK
MPSLRSIAIASGALAGAALLSSTAFAQTYTVRQREVPSDARYQQAPRYQSAPMRGDMGGGFIEFLFGNQPQQPMPPARGRYGVYQPDYAEPQYEVSPYGRGHRAPYMGGQPYDAYGDPQEGQSYGYAQPGVEQRSVDPRYNKQVVEFDGKHAPGTIIIDTPQRFLYLVQGEGRAIRYGIGVGRPGFTWAGVKSITRKAEWPDWTPPPEMLRRRPDLPRHMAGGPDNPLGARALYLGSSLYRIHGSNEPWTIGTAVSSGCIRMRNEDVIDLYGRVKVGTKVVVI